MRRCGLPTGEGALFDTVAVRLPGPGEALAAVARARQAGYQLYDAGDGVVQVSCDETTGPEQLRDVAAALAGLDPADVRLSPRGVRHADVVGNLFFSERVQRLVESYEYDT